MIISARHSFELGLTAGIETPECRNIFTSNSVIIALRYESKNALRSDENSDAMRDDMASGSAFFTVLFSENSLFKAVSIFSDVLLKFIATVKNLQLPLENSPCFSSLNEMYISFFSTRSEKSSADDISAPVSGTVSSRSQS